VIPDFTTTGINSTLNFTVAGTVTDANLNIGNLTHTFDGDIEFRLMRPGGALILVFSDCGGTSENFVNTVISDEGVAPACAAGGPFTGTFQGAPNGIVNPTIMTGFDTFASNGVWTLNVSDDSAADTGTLNAWGITLDGAPPLPVELQKLEVK
jgi:subtilisin-like proprotein convertase family protein